MKHTAGYIRAVQIIEDTDLLFWKYIFMQKTVLDTLV